MTKACSREVSKCRIGNVSLLEAINRARRGSVDAQLSSTLIKQEVSRPPKGRKTACRAVFAFKKDRNVAIVLHVYAKSAKANLTPREFDALDDLSKQVLALASGELAKLVENRGWIEIENGEEK